jgi:hypothetical protein
VSPKTPGPSGVAPSGLFRQQAIEHRAGHRVEGDVLRLPRGFIAWPGRVLYGLLATALACSWLVTLPLTATGPALVVPDPAGDGATVWFALPDTAAQRLARGARLELSTAGEGTLPATVESLGAGELPLERRCWLESRAAGLWPAAPIVGRARVAMTAAAGRSMGAFEARQVRLVVERERALFTLFPDLTSARRHAVR